MTYGHMMIYYHHWVFVIPTSIQNLHRILAASVSNRNSICMAQFESGDEIQVLS